MCLTQPARVVAVSEHDVLVDVDGRRQLVTNLLVPDVRVGDVVVVGLGSVLARLTPAEAASLHELYASAAPEASQGPFSAPGDPSQSPPAARHLAGDRV